MLTQTLKALFTRDLNRLKTEIESYNDEAKIWHIKKGISNSGGNLCLHIVGNLNTYIGAVLGKSGYIRDRESEFSLKNIPKTELLAKVDNTIAIIANSLDTLEEKDLKKEYPEQVFSKKTSTEYFLTHLATHLTYHLGQVNYHRRLLEGSS